VVAAPSTIAQIHETVRSSFHSTLCSSILLLALLQAAEGKAAREEEYSQHQISMPCGSPKRGDIWRGPLSANPGGWTIAGNLKTARPSPKITFSNFGKIDKSPPAIFGPGSVFAGKKDKRESLFRAN
jgi:translation initiation factor 4G